uniref:DUF6533 domain-containing protein n=1 Tax=Mycena chlorophos TaxID=658473 RepID=A0ABQ0LBG6_MYCCL|nr:predicted protein [Mycena chlorophos]
MVELRRDWPSATPISITAEYTAIRGSIPDWQILPQKKRRTTLTALPVLASAQPPRVRGPSRSRRSNLGRLSVDPSVLVMDSYDEDDLRIQLWVANIFNIVGFTLSTYDYFITIDVEVSRFWMGKSRTTLPALLFFTNRYMTLLGNLPFWFTAFWFSVRKCNFWGDIVFTTRRCNSFDTYHQAYIWFSQLLAATIMATRVYALYGRSRKILLFIWTCALAALAVAIWGILMSLLAPDKAGSFGIFLGCGAAKGKIQALGFIIVWVANSFFDFVVFGLTLYQALKDGMWNITLSPQFKGIGLVRLLLRDGLVYFFTIMTCIFGNVSSRGACVVFTNILTSLTVSRLMLNVRDPALDPNRSTQGSEDDIDEIPTWRSADAGLVWAHPQTTFSDSESGPSRGQMDGAASAKSQAEAEP